MTTDSPDPPPENRSTNRARAAATYLLSPVVCGYCKQPIPLRPGVKPSELRRTRNAQLRCCSRACARLLLSARADEEMLGSRFGSLVVTEAAGLDGRGNKLWCCRCDCGNAATKTTVTLRGHPAPSCGCSSHKKGAARHNWTGFGEISGAYWGGIRKTAQYRGLQFDITIEYAWDLFLSQTRRCVLSGLLLQFAASVKTQSERTASLDRIDSSQGYVTGNVQWIHKQFQKMKMDMTDAEFIRACQEVARHHSPKRRKSPPPDEPTLF